MTMKLAPRLGFDWSKINWGEPDAPPSALCSLCSSGIDEDEVPLMMWSRDGHAAQFCEACQRKWWGLGKD